LPVSGTLTCANVGSGVDATNVNCAISGATASACTLQPANTPVASFPVAAVPAGSSIVCNADGTMPASGPLLVTGTTSATNDTNPANNTATFTVAVPTPADMSVSFTGFPFTASPGSTVTGTIHCTNIGTSTAATNATCSVSGATLGACTLQPGGTPVASFPVASVAPSESIDCGVTATMPASGSLSITGSTSATNDSNASNNATVRVVSGPFAVNATPAPTLSPAMIAVLLTLLMGLGVRASKNRGRADH
ncbi:MAG TPA: hypothetical protein VF132_05620, partial [Rudaea sp.]